MTWITLIPTIATDAIASGCSRVCAAHGDGWRRRQASRPSSRRIGERPPCSRERAEQIDGDHEHDYPGGHEQERAAERVDLPRADARRCPSGSRSAPRSLPRANARSASSPIARRRRARTGAAGTTCRRQNAGIREHVARVPPVAAAIPLARRRLADAPISVRASHASTRASIPTTARKPASTGTMSGVIASTALAIQPASNTAAPTAPIGTAVTR